MNIGQVGGRSLLRGYLRARGVAGKTNDSILNGLWSWVSLDLSRL